MARRINHQRKKLILVFIEYGLHFWLLIFICNVAIFYAFRFFIMASTDLPVNEAVIISETPTIIPTQIVTPTVSPTPAGPFINFSFSMPGIGTDGGNLAPLHPVRDVNVYIYKKDSNSEDINVKPLSTIKTHLEHWLKFIGKDTKLKEMERTDCENYFHERTKSKKKLPVSRTTILNEQSTINAMIVGAV